MFLGEIFPTSVKSMGMTFADFIYIGMAIVALKIYYWTLETWGMHVPFLLFSIWGIFSSVVIYFFVPETKGITLEQIQMKLKGLPIDSHIEPKNVDNKNNDNNKS